MSNFASPPAELGVYLRLIKLHLSVVNVLRVIKPLHVTEDTPVFLNHEGEPINFHTWRAKIWYRALRAKELRVRKPYTMRDTFISVGVTNGVKIKWLAEYCGTSMAMIEKHYGKYLGGDSEEQLDRLLGTKSATLSETFGTDREQKQGQVAEISKAGVKWAHLDSNQHKQKTLRRRIGSNSVIFVANFCKYITNRFPKISRRIPLS